MLYDDSRVELYKDVLPKDYVNRKHGRILADIRLYEGSGSNCYLYEDRYKTVRNALEDLKTCGNWLLEELSDNHLKGKVLSSETQGIISKVLEKHGVGGNMESTRKVLDDWRQNDRSFSSRYQPKFMVNIGRPVLAEYYCNVASRVDRFRENNPEYSTDLDRLVRADATGRSLIFPELWYKEQNSEANERSARDFGYAVKRNLSGLDIQAARIYVSKVPAHPLKDLTAE